MSPTILFVKGAIMVGEAPLPHETASQAVAYAAQSRAAGARRPTARWPIGIVCVFSNRPSIE
jgi:hypothetical protein